MSRKFTVDQTVKVQLTLDGKTDWYTGKVAGGLDQIGQHKIKLDSPPGETYRHVLVKQECIVTWDRIASDEELIAHGKTEIDEVQKWLERGLSTLFPNECSVQKTVNETECYLTIQPYGLTVQPVPVEVASILGFKEFPGWGVDDYKITPGGQWQPDDIEPFTVAAERGPLQIAARACEQVFRRKAEGFWQSVGDELYAQSIKDDERLAEEYFAKKGV